MNYQEARPQIRTGDLIYTAGGETIAGRLIQRFARSQYNHVGMAVWFEDNLLMFEATLAHGVGLRPLSTIGEFYWQPIASAVGDREGDEAHFKDRLWRDIDERYSVLGIVGQALRPIIGSSAARWFTTDSGMYCSELVVEHLDNSFNIPVPSMARPDELERWIGGQYLDETRAKGTIRVWPDDWDGQ